MGAAKGCLRQPFCIVKMVLEGTPPRLSVLLEQCLAHAQARTLQAHVPHRAVFESIDRREICGQLLRPRCARHGKVLAACAFSQRTARAGGSRFFDAVTLRKCFLNGQIVPCFLSFLRTDDRFFFTVSNVPAQ